MSSQRINLTTATPTHPGRISTIRLVSQAVTGPPGADGAGVSVALKEGGTTKVAVATVVDFTAADFDVTTGGVVSLAVTPQPLDTDLTAIAELTSAADKVPYSTGAGTWALADFTAAGRALVDDATAADQRTTLGLGTAATTASTAYATAAQGAAADAALPKVAGGAAVENIGAVEWNVNTVAATGATETLDTSTYGVHDLTMDQSCTLTFSNPAPSGKETEFKLILRGAFTPTFPAAVDWASGSAPTYTSPAVYLFSTVDAGTTWFGFQAGKAFA